MVSSEDIDIEIQTKPKPTQKTKPKSLSPVVSLPLSPNRETSKERVSRFYIDTPKLNLAPSNLHLEEIRNRMDGDVGSQKSSGSSPSLLRARNNSPKQDIFRYVPPNEQKLLAKNVHLQDRIAELEEALNVREEENLFLEHKVSALEEEKIAQEVRIMDLERAIQNYSAMRSNRVSLGQVPVISSRTEDPDPDEIGEKIIEKVENNELVEPLVANQHATSPLDLFSVENQKIVSYVIQKSNFFYWNTRDGFPELSKYQVVIRGMIEKYYKDEVFSDQMIKDMNIMRMNHLQQILFQTYRQYIEEGDLNGKYPTLYQRPVIFYPFFRSSKNVFGWISESEERIHVKTENFNLPERQLDILRECIKKFASQKKTHVSGDQQFILDSHPALFYVTGIDETLVSEQFPKVNAFQWIGHVYIAHHKIKGTHKKIETRIQNLLHHVYHTARLNSFIPYFGAQLIDCVLALSWLKQRDDGKIFALERFQAAKFHNLVQMKKRESMLKQALQLKVPFLGTAYGS